ncbi:flagellar hook-length control protein FliK [Bradyrhizobium sp. SYSU BS000235]|uniref:flagellar hook-length control protein FliK n=1 Tax=Bradyrhizobium sp. SYSU BS000235 TaxID=3411332 RepID=UPI003C711CBA
MSFAINPVFPVISASGATATTLLQPGTTIRAQVLQQLDANRVRIAIPNLTIEVLSEVPLQPGQILQLAVSQTPQGVRLQIVPQTDGQPATANAPAAASASAEATILDILSTAKPAPPPASTNALVSTATDATLLDILETAPKTGTTAGASTTTGGAAAADAGLDVTGNVRVETPTAAAAAGRPLTNLEALAVSAAVQTAAAKQGSLAPLFANLSAALASGKLPQTLQEAAAQLLSLRPKLNEKLSGEDLKTAFRNSGLFLEQSMPNAGGASQSMAGSPDMKAALVVFRQMLGSWLETDAAQEAAKPQGQGSTQGATSQTAASQNSAAQGSASAGKASQGAAAQGATAQGAAAQLGAQSASQTAALPGKATLLLPGGSPSLAPEIDADEIFMPRSPIRPGAETIEAEPKMRIFAPNEPLQAATVRLSASAAGLASLQEVLDVFPKGVRDAVKALLDADAFYSHTVAPKGDAPAQTPPPPFRGAAPSAQAMARATLGADDAPDAVARHLMKDTDAAIARQTLLQAASLPDRVDLPGLRTDAGQPRWNFEIPFATPQGTAIAQFEISRDGNGVEVSRASKTWRARFSLNVEPTGPVHAIVTLSGERTSVRMWAERPATAAQLRANADQLTHALREAALEPGDIVIRDGTPPPPAPPPAGQFLDRAS